MVVIPGAVAGRARVLPASGLPAGKVLTQLAERGPNLATGATESSRPYGYRRTRRAARYYSSPDRLQSASWSRLGGLLASPVVSGSDPRRAGRPPYPEPFVPCDSLPGSASASRAAENAASFIVFLPASLGILICVKAIDRAAARPLGGVDVEPPEPKGVVLLVGSSGSALQWHRDHGTDGRQ